jgi:hypothetical protein
MISYYIVFLLSIFTVSVFLLYSDTLKQPAFKVCAYYGEDLECAYFQRWP